jgi:hypothetical protein
MSDTQIFIILILAILPFLASLKGQGGVWQFLSLVMGAIAVWAYFAILGFAGFLAVWIVAWIFAGVALGRRRPDASAIISPQVAQTKTVFEPDGIHAGIPYRVSPDGSIEAIVQGTTVRFADHAKFSAATGATLDEPTPPPLPPEQDAETRDASDAINRFLKDAERPVGKRSWTERAFRDPWTASLVVLAVAGMFIYFVTHR